MIFAYTSRLGNSKRLVRRVADKAKPRPLQMALPWNITDPVQPDLNRALEYAEKDQRQILLFFPSYRRYNRSRLGLQYVPLSVEKFLLHGDGAFGSKIAGIVGTGNRTFGPEFCYGARELSQLLEVPLVAEVDLAGTDMDDETILDFFAAHTLGEQAPA